MSGLFDCCGSDTATSDAFWSMVTSSKDLLVAQIAPDSSGFLPASIFLAALIISTCFLWKLIQKRSSSS